MNSKSKNSEKISKVHIPVLLDELLQLFEGKEIETFYEGTLGLGGHAEAISKAHPEVKLYMGCDKDTRAIELAKKKLEPWSDKVEFIHDSFSNLDSHLAERGIEQIDGFFLT